MSSDTRAFYLKRDIKALIKGLSPKTDVGCSRTQIAIDDIEQACVCSSVEKPHKPSSYGRYVDRIV